MYKFQEEKNQQRENLTNKIQNGTSSKNNNQNATFNEENQFREENKNQFTIFTERKNNIQQVSRTKMNGEVQPTKIRRQQVQWKKSFLRRKIKFHEKKNQQAKIFMSKNLYWTISTNKNQHIKKFYEQNQFH